MASLLLLQIAGCTSTPTVTLKPAHDTQPITVPFNRAYFSPTQSGEDRIILLNDPIDQPTTPASDGTLPMSSAPPLWQVLSIQLHWRTQNIAKQDSLVASNAVLHWYVYGKPTSKTAGALHYVGSGSVSVSTTDSGADVTITSADLKLQDQHGNLRDPFGQFTLTTRFHADTNAPRVKMALDDIQKAIAEADQK